MFTNKENRFGKNVSVDFCSHIVHLSSTQQASEQIQLFMLGHDKPFDSFDCYQMPKENMTLKAGLHWEY
jgi:hypothetical protein